MTDRPVDTRESRTGNITLIALALAALVVLLLVFGSRMFNAGDKSVDVNKAQPNIEQPATRDKSAY